MSTNSIPDTVIPSVVVLIRDWMAGINDSKIHQNFKLWPNNYIAYDLLHSVNKFKAFYTEEEKKRFIEVMTQKMDKLEGNISLLNNIYLEIYANPVKNQLKL